MNPCADGLIGALEPKPTGVEHTTTIWRQRSRVTPRGRGDRRHEKQTDITDGSYWTILTREKLSHLLGVAEVTFYAGVAHA